MQDPLEARVTAASTWDERVEEIRRIPEVFGQAQHSAAYASLAQALYRPNLSPQFAYVQWPPEYELPGLQETYGELIGLLTGLRELIQQLSKLFWSLRPKRFASSG